MVCFSLFDDFYPDTFLIQKDLWYYIAIRMMFLWG
jgi:hypothetical protein